MIMGDQGGSETILVHQRLDGYVHEQWNFALQSEHLHVFKLLSLPSILVHSCRSAIFN
jgi:hypothetical protein